MEITAWLTRKNSYRGGIGIVTFPHNIKIERETVALGLPLGFVEEDAELCAPSFTGVINFDNGLVVLVCIHIVQKATALEPPAKIIISYIFIYCQRFGFVEYGVYCGVAVHGDCASGIAVAVAPTLELVAFGGAGGECHLRAALVESVALHKTNRLVAWQLEMAGCNHLGCNQNIAEFAKHHLVDVAVGFLKFQAQLVGAFGQSKLCFARYKIIAVPAVGCWSHNCVCQRLLAFVDGYFRVGVLISCHTHCPAHFLLLGNCYGIVGPFACGCPSKRILVVANHIDTGIGVAVAFVACAKINLVVGVVALVEVLALQVTWQYCCLAGVWARNGIELCSQFQISGCLEFARIVGVAVAPLLELIAGFWCCGNCHGITNVVNTRTRQVATIGSVSRKADNSLVALHIIVLNRIAGGHSHIAEVEVANVVGISAKVELNAYPVGTSFAYCSFNGNISPFTLCNRIWVMPCYCITF